MIERKNDLNESCSSDLVFLRENHFQRDLVAILPQKLTLNAKNALLLSTYFKIWVTVGKRSTHWVNLCSNVISNLNKQPSSTTLPGL